MKIIFLDVDGVLNSDKTKERINGWVFVENYKIAIIRRIMNRTGARIVLDSTWRQGFYGVTQKKPGDLSDWGIEEYEALKQRCSEYGVWFFDHTEWPETGDRGAEIQRWIQKYTKRGRDPIESFVIIDDVDICISEKFPDNFVQTSGKYGITDEDAERAIKILGERGE